MSFSACVTVWLVFPPFIIIALFICSFSIGALPARKRLERFVLGFLGKQTAQRKIIILSNASYDDVTCRKYHTSSSSCPSCLCGQIKWHQYYYDVSTCCQCTCLGSRLACHAPTWKVFGGVTKYLQPLSFVALVFNCFNVLLPPAFVQFRHKKVL